MKKNTLVGLLTLATIAVVFVILGGATNFHAGSIKTAQAQTTTVQCLTEQGQPDGTTNCGMITPYNTSVIPQTNITSGCSLSGKGDYGGEYCTQAGIDGTNNPQGPDGSWAVYGTTVGYVPTSAILNQYNDDPYHTVGVFNGASITLWISATNGGTANAGNASVSDLGCGCGFNDVNPKNGDDAACESARASADGTANPGDPITIQAEAICKPNQPAGNSCIPGSGPNSCGKWASGIAWISQINDVTWCDNSANPNSPYIDPNNHSLGRRDYTPTAYGICTWDNQPTNTTPQPNLGLSASNAVVDDSNPNSSVQVINAGNQGSTMDWYSDNDGCDGVSCVTYAPTSGGGLVVSALTPWIHVTEADTALAAGDFATVSFQYNHSQVLNVGENNPNLARVTFRCIDKNCISTTTVDYDASYIVPGPTITQNSFNASPISVPMSGGATVLSWSTSNANEDTGTPVTLTMCANTAAPSPCTNGTVVGNFPGDANGSTTVTLSSPAAFTLTVKGLSDQTNATGNVVSQTIYVTTTSSPVPSCSANQNPVTLPSGGGSVPVSFTGSHDPGNSYSWSTNSNGPFGTATTNPFSASFNTAGTQMVYVKASDGLMGNCSVTVNPAPGVPSIGFSFEDNTSGVSVSNTSTDPKFTDGDTWQYNVTTSNIPVGSTYELFSSENGGPFTPGSPTTLKSTLPTQIGSWTPPSAANEGTWEEYIEINGVDSNHIKYQVVPQAFSCSVSANPQSVSSGGNSTITWTSSPIAGNGKCAATGGTNGWSGAQNGSGQFNATGITASTNFNMSCLNPSNSQPVNCSQSVTPYTVSVVANSPTVTGVQVTCPSSVQVGQTGDCSASVSGTGNFSSGVDNWSVSGIVGGNSSVGTINSFGVYTAPASVPSPASVSVTAQSQEDSVTSNQATISITGSQGFTCSVTAPANVNYGDPATVGWSSSPASSNCTLIGGTSDWSGQTGAKSVGGSGSVNVSALYANTTFDANCVNANGGPLASCSATVLVTQPTTTCGGGTLSCSPSSQNLDPNSQATFCASGGNPPYTWDAGSLSDTQYGTANDTIDVYGSYGDIGQTLPIKLYDDTNSPYYTPSSTCYVVMGDPITSVGLTCPQTLEVGQSGNCVATVKSSGNNFSYLVNWSSTGGSVVDQSGNPVNKTDTGIFTAPNTTGPVTVKATSQQDSTQNGVALITITPALTNSVSLTSNATASTTNEMPVLLTATAAGTATGTLNYTFWWDCPAYANAANPSVAEAIQACNGDPTNNPALGTKVSGTSNTTQVESHMYSSSGIPTPIVIVERGTSPAAEGNTSFPVVTGHFECVSNACTSVPGSNGVNRCSTDADCGGGNPVVHSTCNASEDACINVAGQGNDDCSGDGGLCGGNHVTHLACENNSCLIVDGASTSSANDCLQVGTPCVFKPTLSFSVSPSRIVSGNPTYATWSSTNVDSCVASASPAENNDWPGISQPATTSAGYPSGQYQLKPSSPGVTSQEYDLTCMGPGGSVMGSSTVAVTPPSPVTCTQITVTPPVIVPPVTATLSWTCTNTDSCTLNNFPVTMVANGNGTYSASVSEDPTSTTPYTLNCGNGWTTYTQNVIVSVKGGSIQEVNPQ